MSSSKGSPPDDGSASIDTEEVRALRIQSGALRIMHALAANGRSTDGIDGSMKTNGIVAKIAATMTRWI